MAKTQAKYIYHKEEIFLKILKKYQPKQKRKQITKKKTKNFVANEKFSHSFFDFALPYDLLTFKCALRFGRRSNPMGVQMPMFFSVCVSVCVCACIYSGYCRVGSAAFSLPTDP